MYFGFVLVIFVVAKPRPQSYTSEFTRCSFFYLNLKHAKNKSGEKHTKNWRNHVIMNKKFNKENWIIIENQNVRKKESYCMSNTLVIVDGSAQRAKNRAFVTSFWND